jgi:hypothetical protein
MIEVTGDIWKHWASETFGYIVIPTNGVVKKDGTAVMGAGLAKELLRVQDPEFHFWLGKTITKHGNHTFLNNEEDIFAFPTKHHWRNKSDLDLIRRSARELVYLSHVATRGKIYLPRVGCGLGGLDWESEVKPILAEILTEDRFVVVSQP